MRFVSERAMKLHLNYVESERHRLSVFEKSYPFIIGKSAKDIIRMKCDDKRAVVSTILNIKCHELYFSSFGNQYQQSSAVREDFSTEATFLYELYKTAVDANDKFLFIYFDGRRIRVKCGDELTLLSIKNYTLIIDLCEHAYFLDYGFDRAEYLKRLLPFLNLSLLDKKMCHKD